MAIVNEVRGSDYMNDHYFREFFTVTHILHGELRYLEEIKDYIIETYVKKGLLRLIRPTYSQKTLAEVRESHYISNEPV